MHKENRPKQNELLARVEGAWVYICVNGRGSFKNSPHLKRFVDKMAQRRDTSKIVINLGNCLGMDSTFMGVLAGMTTRLKKKDIDLLLTKLSSKNRALLHTLGVDQVVTIYGKSRETPTPQSSSKLQTINGRENPEEKETAATMLEAHQTLAGMNRANLDRFQDVITFLEEDLENISDNEASQ